MYVSDTEKRSTKRSERITVARRPKHARGSARGASV
jgi:hypothetical protein